MFVDVGLIHTAIVLFSVPTPANVILDTAIGVGSFVEDLRHLVKLTHLVIVTDVV